MPAKEKVIRWSKWRAASEFGIDQKTLTGRLTRYGIEPGRDNNYTTKQICDAVFGDIDNEKLRLTKEQADKLEIENAQSRGDLVKMSEIVDVMQRGLQAMTATVMGMTDLQVEHREKIIEQLRECGERVVAGDGDSDAATPLHSEPMG